LGPAANVSFSCSFASALPATTLRPLVDENGLVRYRASKLDRLLAEASLLPDRAHPEGPAFNPRGCA
jgi:hypothetical protein